MIKQLNLQFLIRITEGTTVIRGEEHLYIDDFPENGFIIDLEEIEIHSLYYQFIEENYTDCFIGEPTFLIFPIINDEVLDIELSDEVDPDGVWLTDIENWLKSKEPLQWLRTYQLENNLGI
jgi:hypothetical protein